MLDYLRHRGSPLIEKGTSDHSAPKPVQTRKSWHEYILDCFYFKSQKRSLPVAFPIQLPPLYTPKQIPLIQQNEGMEALKDHHEKLIQQTQYPISKVVFNVTDEILNRIEFNSNWDRYIVKKNEFTNLYSDNQWLYGSLMANFSDLLAKKIHEGWDFKSLFELACYGRHLMIYNQNNASSYKLAGRQRILSELSVSTSLTNGYEKLGRDLEILTEKWKNTLSELVQADEFLISYYTTYKKNKILLSRVSYCGEVHHTSPRNLRQVMPKIEKLFNNALQPNLELEDQIERLGQFFHLFCHAKPVFLGDPSIGEMLFKSVLIAKGLDVPGWVEGVIPWEETMKEYDPVVFGKKFADFFDRLPE